MLLSLKQLGKQVIRLNTISTVNLSVYIVNIFPVPSASPKSVTVSDVTISSIIVRWGLVNCIQQNGEITGYSVKYGVQGDGSTQTVNVSGSDTTETTISGLNSSTSYTIEVAAVNSAGIGIFSNTIMEQTNDGNDYCGL